MGNWGLEERDGMEGSETLHKSSVSCRHGKGWRGVSGSFGWCVRRRERTQQPALRAGAFWAVRRLHGHPSAPHCTPDPLCIGETVTQTMRPALSPPSDLPWLAFGWLVSSHPSVAPGSPP